MDDPKTINLEVNMRALAKARPRFERRSNRVHMPPRYVNFKNALSAAFKSQMIQKGYKKIDGYVGISIDLEYKNRVWPDVDNAAGSIMDVLNGLAWEDDRLVCELEVRKHHTGKDVIAVMIWPIQKDEIEIKGIYEVQE